MAFYDPDKIGFERGATGFTKQAWLPPVAISAHPPGTYTYGENRRQAAQQQQQNSSSPVPTQQPTGTTPAPRVATSSPQGATTYPRQQVAPTSQPQQPGVSVPWRGANASVMQRYQQKFNTLTPAQQRMLRSFTDAANPTAWRSTEVGGDQGTWLNPQVTEYGTSQQTELELWKRFNDALRRSPNGKVLAQNFSRLTPERQKALYDQSRGGIYDQYLTDTVDSELKKVRPVGTFGSDGVGYGDLDPLYGGTSTLRDRAVSVAALERRIRQYELAARAGDSTAAAMADRLRDKMEDINKKNFAYLNFVRDYTASNGNLPEGVEKPFWWDNDRMQTDKGYSEAVLKNFKDQLNEYNNVIRNQVPGSWVAGGVTSSDDRVFFGRRPQFEAFNPATYDRGIYSTLSHIANLDESNDYEANRGWGSRALRYFDLGGLLQKQEAAKRNAEAAYKQLGKSGVPLVAPQTAAAMKHLPWWLKYNPTFMPAMAMGAYMFPDMMLGLEGAELTPEEQKDISTYKGIVDQNEGQPVSTLGRIGSYNLAAQDRAAMPFLAKDLANLAIRGTGAALRTSPRLYGSKLSQYLWPDGTRVGRTAEGLPGLISRGVSNPLQTVVHDAPSFVVAKPMTVGQALRQHPFRMVGRAARQLARSTGLRALDYIGARALVDSTRYRHPIYADPSGTMVDEKGTITPGALQAIVPTRGPMVIDGGSSGGQPVTVGDNPVGSLYPRGIPWWSGANADRGLREQERRYNIKFPNE